MHFFRAPLLLLQKIHYRIGSSEKARDTRRNRGSVLCRIGSSERQLGLGYIGCMRLLPIALLFAACAPAWAANYATCILSKMPGAQNDVVANAVYKICKSENPGGLPSVEQGSGRGLFGYNSGAECTIKKAGETRSGQAASMIAVACRKLYDKPNFFDQFDPSTARPVN